MAFKMNGFSGFIKTNPLKALSKAVENYKNKKKKTVTTKKHANKLFEYLDPDSDTTFGEVVAKKKTKNIIKK